MTAGSGCGLSLFVFPKEHVAEKRVRIFVYFGEKLRYNTAIEKTKNRKEGVNRYEDQETKRDRL